MTSGWIPPSPVAGSGHIRASGEMLLQPRHLVCRPPLRFGYGEPRVDVVFGRKEMSVAHRRTSGDGHVDGELQHPHDRVPAQLRRNVRTAWRIHPCGAAIGIAIIEKRDRIARVLQISSWRIDDFRRVLRRRLLSGIGRVVPYDRHAPQTGC